MAVLDDDMNRRQCAIPIPRREGWITIDRLVFSQSDLIVHWRRRQDLDVVYDVGYAFHAFDDVLSIRLESWASYFSYERNRAACYEECQVVKDAVIREHYELVSDLSRNPGFICRPRDKCIVMIRVVVDFVVFSGECDKKHQDTNQNADYRMSKHDSSFPQPS